MPRRGHISKRAILPDPVYNSELVARFVNKIMVDGKKGLAQRNLYTAMDLIAERTGKDPLEVFETAVKNVMPVVEVRSRRVGGATYQVPIEVRTVRKTSLALRWLAQYSAQRNERTLAEKLAGELIDAANGAGGAFKKKEDVHRMAEANRAFAHYRW